MPHIPRKVILGRAARRPPGYVAAVLAAAREVRPDAANLTGEAAADVLARFPVVSREYAPAEAEADAALWPAPNPIPLTPARVLHGAAGIARAVTGTGGADADMIARRTAVCAACDQAVSVAGVLKRCRICSCHTWSKIRNRNESCPLGKWRPVPTDLVLANRLCPGDFVVMSGVLRELHRAHHGRYRTAVRTPVPEIWQGNPHVTPERDLIAPRVVECGFTIDGSTRRNRHFIEIWADDLAGKLGITIPVVECRGDVYLTAAEREWPADLIGLERRPYWLLSAGSKSDCQTKRWADACWQEVIDHFAGRVTFVQVGHAPNAHHFQPDLRGTINLVGRTGIRDMVRLVHHAQGVLCGITFAMHLAAAVPMPAGREGTLRPCVVVAGGREPVAVWQYPGHQGVHTVGALPCNAQGGCWKSDLTLRPKRTTDLCLSPSAGGIARCMELLTPDRVIAAVESYYAGGAMAHAGA